jgi:hypothetical protein
MELSQDRPAQPYGLLYPMMLIAAIAVIVFSILGIVSIAGWMPNALSSAHAGTQVAHDGGASETVPVARSSAAFECAECGMIEGIREIERNGALTDLRVETDAPSRL